MWCVTHVIRGAHDALTHTCHIAGLRSSVATGFYSLKRHDAMSCVHPHAITLDFLGRDRMKRPPIRSMAKTHTIGTTTATIGKLSLESPSGGTSGGDGGDAATTLIVTTRSELVSIAKPSSMTAESTSACI